MDLFVPAVAMVALIKKFIDFSKYVTNKDRNGALTQIYAWIIGVAVVWLFAQTVWADKFGFGDLMLSAFNLASIVAVGLSLGSVGGVVTDVIKSRDNTDSAKMPSLLPGTPPQP